MNRFGQVGIALGALGIIVAIMGLFPGVTGVEPTPGIGVVQVFMLLAGYALLIFGAYIYVKVTFYFGVTPTLFQQVGIRLSLTGLLFAALSGLSDILGFGSHVRTETTDIFFGQLQAFGLLTSFMVSAIGILIYAVTGTPRSLDEGPQANDAESAIETPEAPAMVLESAEEHTPA